ncbi:MAG: hypothetical protein F4Y10_01340 [Synechococcus sp. SB0663_bin_10]|nr:hypothetical protein [Synechococcus sp. SB0663_bin_10]
METVQSSPHPAQEETTQKICLWKTLWKTFGLLWKLKNSFPIAPEGGIGFPQILAWFSTAFSTPWNGFPPKLPQPDPECKWDGLFSVHPLWADLGLLGGDYSPITWATASGSGARFL